MGWYKIKYSIGVVHIDSLFIGTVFKIPSLY